MHDPLSQHMGEADPYGHSRAFGVLHQLFHSAHPGPLAAAAELFLKRLTLLEMILEEKGLEIGEEELTRYLHDHHHEVDEETHKLAQLYFGRVASREGG